MSPSAPSSTKPNVASSALSLSLFCPTTQEGLLSSRMPGPQVLAALAPRVDVFSGYKLKLETEVKRNLLRTA